jgi:hypothetical protein
MRESRQEWCVGEWGAGGGLVERVVTLATDGV